MAKAEPFYGLRLKLAYVTGQDVSRKCLKTPFRPDPGRAGEQKILEMLCFALSFKDISY